MLSFTYDQAAEIAEDFEDLVDTEYLVHGDAPKTFIIDFVGIAPYAAPERERFIALYLESHNGPEALSQYSGDEFDVLIIAQNAADSADIAITAIRDYVAANGVNYAFK